MYDHIRDQMQVFEFAQLLYPGAPVVLGWNGGAAAYVLVRASLMGGVKLHRIQLSGDSSLEVNEDGPRRGEDYNLWSHNRKIVQALASLAEEVNWFDQTAVQVVLTLHERGEMTSLFEAHLVRNNVLGEVLGRRFTVPNPDKVKEEITLYLYFRRRALEYFTQNNGVW